MSGSFMEQDQLDGVLPCANASGSDEGSLLIMCMLVEQIKSKKKLMPKWKKCVV